MSGRAHHTDYNEETTALCERVLVTLLGDLGPWRQRIYLAGGLAPRYLVGQLPEGARAHVGTTDIDLVIGIALGDETPETYRTLQNNLQKAGFEQKEPSFRWARGVEGIIVVIEFLCETDQVAPGGIFKPTREGESTGSKLGAFNVRGAHLVRDDFVERHIDAERLDGGGLSRVTVRVANVLPYTVLKVLAFQDRHENKDAYDLVFTLFNADGGPESVGERCAASPVANHPQVDEAIGLLEERFATETRTDPAPTRCFSPSQATRTRELDSARRLSPPCAPSLVAFGRRPELRILGVQDPTLSSCSTAPPVLPSSTRLKPVLQADGPPARLEHTLRGQMASIRFRAISWQDPCRSCRSPNGFRWWVAMKPRL